MRIHPNPLITCVLVISSFFVNAQQPSRFTIGGRTPAPPTAISREPLTKMDRELPRFHGKARVILQFTALPTEAEKQGLLARGVILQEYIPDNAYAALIAAPLNPEMFRAARVGGITTFDASDKIQPLLRNGRLPSWAVTVEGKVDLWVSFPAGFSLTDVTAELSSRQFEITSTLFSNYGILAVRAEQHRLTELASYPFISYVQAAPKKDEPLNDHSIGNTKANVLQLPGGRNLQGDGVVIGIGDDSNPMRHVDLEGRVINHSAQTGNSHGLHVSGTAAGAGNVRELARGFAPHAKIIAQSYSNILGYAPQYVQDHGMVITNNSYGNVVNDCATFGIYDLYSRVMDQQAFQLPHLQHVFASGNSGSYNCYNYTAGFSNVLGAYQTAKNTIVVGNGNAVYNHNSNSSKGPVRDGRVKPEITAQGTSVYSLNPVNGYAYNTGTSMSSPAVAGGLALLYQRYRQLHGGADPENGLMKALLVNGADDKGNPGVDYRFGFGWMNLLRSVKMLENGNYFTGSVNAAATNTHSITIPAGSTIALLKVMLYWNDSAAAPYSSRALVNDLDLEVVSPSATIYYPQILDTIPANVNNPATTGPDHWNNIEQVVITNPGTGTFTFNVKGTTIPLAPQHGYYLVFDTLAAGVTLTYPAGGERMVTGEQVYVTWDAYGNPANDFTIEQSVNGGPFAPVVATVAASARQVSWAPTMPFAENVRLKIIHNGTGNESISNPFTVLGVPANFTATVSCPGYITTSWNAVLGATDYEIFILRNNEMLPVATTTATTYTISGLSPDSTYWVSVRARINGQPSRRVDALGRQPNTGTCTGTVSDNDLRLETILAPRSGRRFTSTELTATTPVTIRIRNLDDVTATGNIDVSYQLDNGAFIHETIVSPAIAAGGTFDYTFATTIDLSATGTYNLRAAIDYPGDAVAVNDSLAAVVRQLDNPFIDLAAAPFLDDLEAAPKAEQKGRVVGLAGLDRYDFIASTIYGRVRTFLTSGNARSGNRALTLDTDRFHAPGNIDSLTGTFNVAGFDVLTDDIRLDFQYKHHGQTPNAANNTWIRGNDQQPWVPVFDLYANQEAPGVFKRSSSIEVSDLLDANGQVFTSSFQVRWGQWGNMLAADYESGAGYTLDDIRLYRVIDDIQMIRIDTPIVSSCGLGNAEQVKVTVRNSANHTINSIPVSMQADGGTIHTETIPSIGPNSTVQYTFTATVDLSSFGDHTVRTWVDLATDTYRDNDTAVVELHNSPIISTFPYLQDFEAGDGNWYTRGKNSSWALGTPSAPRIRRAASGVKAWKTGLAGNYNDAEFSYLYSPCFDITGMTNPTLSLSLALDLEDCGAGGACDVGYIEYSADGVNWTRLGNTGSGTNWYNRNYPGNPAWSIENYTRWHVATTALPTGMSRLRLRVVLSSDPYVNREGIAIDDVHIYDNVNGIYTGPPLTSAPVVQIPTGTGWTDFTSGGKLIASINANGQAPGPVEAMAYIHSGSVRSYQGQYYHNRNITLKPAVNILSDSVTVRMYFTDAETEALINATGCAGCTKPASAYDLGVSKYSDANDAMENGSLSDDLSGSWNFITSANARKVPFDNGYYVEFKVIDFSEFWLNNGGVNNNQPLPVTLLSFNARKQGEKNVVVEWKTEAERDLDSYVVEVAKGNQQLQANNFTTIGQVTAAGSTFYSFTDEEDNKSGVRYYRLRMVDRDGSFTWSPVRPVVFRNEIKWQVYPNPTDGRFSVIYQVASGEIVDMVVRDVTGRQVAAIRRKATGFVEKADIDLGEAIHAAGLYLVEVSAGDRKELFRVLKR